MTAPEQMRATLRAELERQCGIGAGEFSVCPETGLWQVSADLDIDSLVRALTRPAPAGLVEALAEYDAKMAECPINNGKRYDPEKPCPRCRATVNEGCGVDGSASYAFIKRIRTALRNAGAAS